MNFEKVLNPCERNDEHCCPKLQTLIWVVLVVVVGVMASSPVGEDDERMIPHVSTLRYELYQMIEAPHVGPMEHQSLLPPEREGTGS